MSEILQNAKPPETIADGFRKHVPTVVTIIVVSLCSFWWGSHNVQTQMQFQVQANTIELQKQGARNDIQDETQKQLLLAITKLAESQTRLVDDVKEIKDDHKRARNEPQSR